MWRRLLGIAGKFLSARALVVALSAILTAGGTYVLYALKDRGSLEAQLDQAQQALEAQQAASDGWQAHAQEIKALAKRFDEYDQDLRKQREDRERLARVVDGRISDLADSMPEVQGFLSRPAPAALVRVLCDDSTIDPGSADCRALDTTELSGEL